MLKRFSKRAQFAEWRIIMKTYSHLKKKKKKINGIACCSYG